MEEVFYHAPVPYQVVERGDELSDSVSGGPADKPGILLPDVEALFGTFDMILKKLTLVNQLADDLRAEGLV